MHALKPVNETFRAEKNLDGKKKIVCQGSTAAAANGIMAGFESAGVFLFYSRVFFPFFYETGKLRQESENAVFKEQRWEDNYCNFKYEALHVRAS